MDMFVFWFFVKRFLVGFGIGVFIKFFLAVTLKTKTTIGGIIRTSCVTGILYIILTIYVVNRIG